MSANSLPEVPFGPHSISRLIAGGNPPHGGSHQTRLMGTHMHEYFTPERTVEFLGRCADQGINTWQTHFSDKARQALAAFRADGRQMQWICICPPDEINNPDTLKSVLEIEPMGIAVHGESTDSLWRKGEINKVKDCLPRLRDAGIQVGISTHNPAVIEYTEENGWDTDFYMACVYDKSRSPEALIKIMRETPIGEVYLPSDVPRMCKTISATPKTCLAFKILAAGRACDTPEQVRNAFEFVLGHIKKTDAVIVGMYPRYTDQITENATLVRELTT